MQKPKISRNETPSEAASFTTRNNRYRTLGLCPRCASQAAYCHAHGFTTIHPPCNGCAGLVASLPHRSSNPAWRKVLATTEAAA